MTTNALRWAGHGAWLTLGGTLLSGPVGVALVELTRPQPPWRDAATFVAHYHPIQTLPYLLGFALVAGLVVLVVALGELAPAELRPRASVAVVLAAAFAALVFLNYVLQTTFVPGLVARFRSSDAPVVEAFTMANPRSLGWCLEMWAYGIVGVATWLVAPVFGGTPLERAARLAFVANGVASVASALATAAWPGWVLTPLGFVGYGVWNLLVVAMAVLSLVAFRARAAKEAFA
jgi:hypothetical protein